MTHVYKDFKFLKIVANDCAESLKNGAFIDYYDDENTSIILRCMLDQRAIDELAGKIIECARGMQYQCTPVYSTDNAVIICKLIFS
ncbi:MAG: hypothetical protein RR598_10885 [Anaerorhabdus sp.]